MPNEQTLPRGDSDIVIRPPERCDGAAVWRLARDSGSLDLNSQYAYLLWCDRFSDTSVVVDVDGELAGFVCGFRPQDEPEVLFVWQVVVGDAHRGKGLARGMVMALLQPGEGFRFVEATVTPSNSASQRLFRSLAELLGCPREESPYLQAADFPEGDHEPEILFRIGPFDLNRLHANRMIRP